MRLWHEDLIKVLPDMQLKGQHRECCALRGKGWGRKHSTVDYVFKYPIENLVVYHFAILAEIEERKLKFELDEQWKNPCYRGKKSEMHKLDEEVLYKLFMDCSLFQNKIYEEHNEEYMVDCIENLKGKLEVKLALYEQTYGKGHPKVDALFSDIKKLIVFIFKKLVGSI